MLLSDGGANRREDYTVISAFSNLRRISMASDNMFLKVREAAVVLVFHSIFLKIESTFVPNKISTDKSSLYDLSLYDFLKHRGILIVKHFCAFDNPSVVMCLFTLGPSFSEVYRMK